MAQCDSTTVIEREFTLRLSEEEACLLAGVLGESYDHRGRTVFAALADEMDAAGVAWR